MDALTAAFVVMGTGFLALVVLCLLIFQTFLSSPRRLQPWCIVAVCAAVVLSGWALGRRLDSVVYVASVKNMLERAGDVEVIRSEGLALLRLYDSDTRQRGKRVPGLDIPESRWPAAIARTRPHAVRVIPRRWIALHVGMKGRVRTEVLIGTNGIPGRAEQLHEDMYLVTH